MNSKKTNQKNATFSFEEHDSILCKPADYYKILTIIRQIFHYVMQFYI